jgi:hypothetical protein
MQQALPLLAACFLLGLLLNPEDGGNMFVPCTALDRIVSHKIVLFIATALKTSKSTFYVCCTFVARILPFTFLYIFTRKFYTFFPFLTSSAFEVTMKLWIKTW